MAGRVERLFLNTATRQPMRDVAEVAAIENVGLDGDRHNGGARQVLIVESEILESMRLQAGELRENVVVRGVRVQGLSVGAKLKMGEVELEITRDCTPCRVMDDIRPGLKEELVGKRGMLSIVTKGGNLRVGDVVELL